ATPATARRRSCAGWRAAGGGRARRPRHSGRTRWHRVGNGIRRRDPGLLVRESLGHGEFTAGARGLEEIAACRRENLVVLVVWVANRRVGKCSTVTFTQADCDRVVDNHGSLDEVRGRLLEMARSASLPLGA